MYQFIHLFTHPSIHPTPTAHLTDGELWERNPTWAVVQGTEGDYPSEQCCGWGQACSHFHTFRHTRTPVLDCTEAFSSS
jgi:hypothetical protein